MSCCKCCVVFVVWILTSKFFGRLLVLVFLREIKSSEDLEVPVCGLF